MTKLRTLRLAKEMLIGCVRGAFSISGSLTEITSELTSTLYFVSLEEKFKGKIKEHGLKFLNTGAQGTYLIFASNDFGSKSPIFWIIMKPTPKLFFMPRKKSRRRNMSSSRESPKYFYNGNSFPSCCLCCGLNSDLVLRTFKPFWLLVFIVRDYDDNSRKKPGNETGLKI